MTEEEPAMDDGFLIVDRKEDGVEPRYIIEHFVKGEVRHAWVCATPIEMAQTINDMGNLYYGGSDARIH